MCGVEIVNIGVVEAAFFRIRGAFNEVVNLATDLGLVEIHLHIFGVSYFLVLIAADTCGDQAVTRQQSRSRTRRMQFNRLGNNPLLRLAPTDPVPGRRLAPGPLDKVKYSGGNHQGCADEH